MEYIVKIKNLTYKDLFNNLELNIKKGSFTSIVGSNGCGKSTLLKIMLGLIKTDANIEIDNCKLNKEIYKKIGVIFDNPEANFISETPKEDMKLLLKNMQYDEQIIEKTIIETAKKFKIEEILDCSLSNLSGGEKQLVALATVSLINPIILILDNALTMLDGMTKEKILKILKKINKDKKTTIIYITHDLEDTLYGTDIALLQDNKIVLNEKLEKAFTKEKLFKKSGLELPFMVTLSIKLKYYNLIDKVILDMDKMVNALWK